MTSKKNLTRRVESLEDKRGTADDDEPLRYMITRRTVNGELIEKEECSHNPESVDAGDIDGFNFVIDYRDGPTFPSEVEL